MGEVFLTILWIPAIIGMPLLPIMGLYGVVVSIPALFEDKGQYRYLTTTF